MIHQQGTTSPFKNILPASNHEEAIQQIQIKGQSAKLTGLDRKKKKKSQCPERKKG